MAKAKRLGAWHNGSRLLSETELATFHLKHTTKRGRKRDPELHARVTKLLEQNLTPKQIIEKTQIPWSTVYRIAQEYRRLVLGDTCDLRQRNKIAKVQASIDPAAKPSQENVVVAGPS